MNWLRPCGKVADDHKGCPVGAHTHNVTLSPAEQQGLMGRVQTMVGLSFLKMEDVPQIPTRNSARTAASFGCVGNRVYTGAGDAEAYFAIPGPQLGAVEENLAVIGRANQALEKFHRGRAATD